jgi:hypothetical protein
MDDQWTRRIADRLNWDRTVTAQFTDSPPVPAADSHAAPTSDPRAAVTAVMLAPTADEFVRRAYRLALGRDPSPDELAQRVRRMKLPFFTRGRMLRRLLGSVEAQLVLRAEQVRAAAHLQAVLPQLLATADRLAASVAQLRKTVERAAEQVRAVGGRVDAMEARTGGPRPTG